MKTQDLKDLTLAIVTGEKRDATQEEHNVAASYLRELITGSADLVDALYENSDLLTISKVIDDEIYVLASDRKSFNRFGSNAGEPWIGTAEFYVNEELDRLGDSEARGVTLAEAMAFDPSAALNP